MSECFHWCRYSTARVLDSSSAVLAVVADGFAAPAVFLAAAVLPFLSRLLTPPRSILPIPRQQPVRDPLSLLNCAHAAGSIVRSYCRLKPGQYARLVRVQKLFIAIILPSGDSTTAPPNRSRRPVRLL